MVDSQQEMMLLFKFNMEDLRCNQEGRLSNAQRQRIFREAVGAFCGIFLAGLIIAIGIWKDLSSTSPNLPLLYLYPLLCLGILTAIAFFVYRLNIKPSKEGIVKSTVGAFGINPRSSWFRGNAFFLIGTEHFAVRGNVFGVLKPGIFYKIYYTPTYKRILSIERSDEV